eukprot:TRINITY_DN1585_c0_g1_i2.p1 TRINITY_DN1585_c0_g1~~TRINITY_DN1585_c0_g1_i2.p1  ORF type:complete len:414 (+),score=39.53 TRINITY_DN1585_c0_g1_i2:1105-2346(+)
MHFHEMASVMRGERGGTVLVHQSFRYHKHRATANEIYWRCWRKDCRARARTNLFDLADNDPQVRVLFTDPHSHPADIATVERGRMRQRLLREVTSDPTRPSARIYNAEVNRLRRAQGGGDREPIPRFETFRTSMQRARADLMPPIPQSVDDVQIEGPWAQTWTQDEFLLHADNGWGVFVFATDDNLIKLQRCHTVYMDGTFKSCPRPFGQFFSILGKANGFVIPLVHVLMEQRTVGHYRQVLQAVKRAVRQVTHHQWRPQLIITDFELSLTTAIDTEFPQARTGRCYFHFNQSLWKRIQQLGLAGPYQQDRHLMKQVKMIMALGYLPVALVLMNFNGLAGSRRTRRLLRRYPALRDFLDYVRTTYIQAGCLFPPPVWNVFQRNMDQRTNNNVECKCHFHYMIIVIRDFNLSKC